MSLSISERRKNDPVHIWGVCGLCVRSHRNGNVGGCMKESTLQCHVADYLRLRYPNVLFHSDYGSGIKLTPGQSRIQYRQNGGRRGWPDMFIAEGRGYFVKRGDEPPMFGNFICTAGETDLYICNGLFIELKRDGERILKKKDFTYASEHIKEQARVLNELRERGYAAHFAVGFDQAKQIIDEYLGGPVTGKVEF